MSEYKIHNGHVVEDVGRCFENKTLPLVRQIEGFFRLAGMLATVEIIEDGPAEIETDLNPDPINRPDEPERVEGETKQDRVRRLAGRIAKDLSSCLFCDYGTDWTWDKLCSVLEDMKILANAKGQPIKFQADEPTLGETALTAYIQSLKDEVEELFNRRLTKGNNGKT